MESFLMLDEKGYRDYWAGAPYPRDVSRDYERARHLGAYIKMRFGDCLPYSRAHRYIFEAAYDGAVIIA